MPLDETAVKEALKDIKGNYESGDILAEIIQKIITGSLGYTSPATGPFRLRKRALAADVASMNA